MALTWDSRHNCIETPVGTDTNPTLAVYNGHLYAAWKGSSNDNAMYLSSFDGRSWSRQTRISNNDSYSDIGPTLAVFRGHLYAEWKGNGGDQRLWWSSFDGNQWTSQKTASGQTSLISSMVAFRNVLFSAYRAYNQLEDIWYATFDGAVWARDVKTEFQTSGKPALAVLGNGIEQRLWMLWKGNGMDNRILYSSFDGSRWTPSLAIPPQVAVTDESPSAAVLNSVLYLAWRLDENTINLAAFDGKGNWIPHGYVLGEGISGPTLIAFNDKLVISWKGHDTRIFWTETIPQPGNREITSLIPVGDSQQFGRGISQGNEAVYNVNPYGATQPGNPNYDYPPPPPGRPGSVSYDTQTASYPPRPPTNSPPPGAGYNTPPYGRNPYGAPPTDTTSDEDFPQIDDPQDTDYQTYQSGRHGSQAYGWQQDYSSRGRPPPPPPLQPNYQTPPRREYQPPPPPSQPPFQPPLGPPTASYSNIPPPPPRGQGPIDTFSRDLRQQLPSQDSEPSEDFSWANPNLQRLSEFRYFNHTPPTDEWTVFTVTVNKSNTRLAVLSFDDSQEHIIVKLCDLNSRIIWQKTDIMPVDSVDKLVAPAFSDDGEHLAVVLRQRIEIVDSRNGSVLDHISLENPLPNESEPLRITAIGIGHNLTNVVVSREKGDEVRLDRVILPRASGNGPVLVVSTESLTDVSLAFTARDRKVIAVGKGWGLSSNSRRVFGFGWDSHSRVRQYKNEFAPSGWRMQSPIRTVLWKEEVCVLVHVYDPDDQSQGLHVLSVDGNQVDRFGGERMVVTSARKKVLVLQRKQVFVWSDESKVVQVASLEWDGMPPVQEIKGFAASESQITLVLDDGKFIFLRRH